MAFVFNPDGQLVAKRVKSYITPTELGPDEGALGLDLVPGAVSDSDSVPVDTPVGRFAFVISKPAWMPDVLQKIDQRHTDLLLQPEFFVGDLTRTTGMWSPDTLLASGYNDVLRHPSIETLVHPQMEGGVFSFYADQPSHLAIKPRTGREKKGFILGQPGHRGLVETLPWVVPDPIRPGEPMAERRRRLGEAGEKLAPGSGEACPDPADAGALRGRPHRGRPVARHRREPQAALQALRREAGADAVLAVAAAGTLAQALSATWPSPRAAATSWPPTRSAAAPATGSSCVRSRDGGRTWSEPERRPARSSADEWWPAVAVGAEGQRHRRVGRGRARASSRGRRNHGRSFRPAVADRRLGRRRPVEARARAGQRATWSTPRSSTSARPASTACRRRTSITRGSRRATPSQAERLDTGTPAPLADEVRPLVGAERREPRRARARDVARLPELRLGRLRAPLA